MFYKSNELLLDENFIFTFLRFYKNPISCFLLEQVCHKKAGFFYISACII